MSDAVLTCTNCGAPLSFFGGERTRCAYCLHEQRVPERAQRSLQRNAALLSVFDRAHVEAERAEAMYARGWSMSYGLIAAFGAIGIMMAGSCVLAGLLGRLDADLLVTLLGPGLLFPCLGLFTWHIVRSQQRARDEVLAALPLSTLDVRDDTMVLRCPRCGAGVARTDVQAPIARCGHCGVEALLPVTAIEAGERRLYARIMGIRVRMHAAAQAVNRAT